MRKIGLLLISLMMLTFTGMTQPGQRSIDPEIMAKRQTAQLKEELQLNEDQEKQVYEIKLESGKKFQAIRKEMQPGKRFDGMREKFAAIREVEDEQLKKALTEAQWEKYQEYLKKRREEMQQRRQSNRNRRE